MSTNEADTTAGATPDPAPPNDPEALREEIERTRERLGETVEALAAKADVKAQAQQKVSELTDRVKTTASSAVGTAKKNRGPLAAVAGAITAAIVALLVILRLRKRS